MKWQLRTLIGEYDDMSNGERLTYERLANDTGISKANLNKMGRNRITRADLRTIKTLLDYFSEKLGRKLTTNDLLKYETGTDSTD